MPSAIPVSDQLSEFIPENSRNTRLQFAIHYCSNQPITLKTLEICDILKSGVKGKEIANPFSESCDLFGDFWSKCMPALSFTSVKYHDVETKLIIPTGKPMGWRTTHSERKRTFWMRLSVSRRFLVQDRQTSQTTPVFPDLSTVLHEAPSAGSFWIR
jgi:hypothetical protein